MKIIEIGNKDYPKKLLNIHNPPKKLYVVGDVSILDNFAIGIVGTRNCTKYGADMAKALSYNLAKFNVNVISGMAKGIDRISTSWYNNGKGENNSCPW